MEQRTLGRTRQTVSVVGLGALELGRRWGIGPKHLQTVPTEKDASRLLDGALDAGVTLIDTAAAYHQSERRIGQAIAHRRTEYFLATKCGEHNAEPDTFYDFSYGAIERSIKASLANLKTTRIDLLQIHFGPEPWRVIAEGHTLRAMQDAREQGLVRYLGASCNVDVADALIRSGEFDALQLEYNLLQRDAEDTIKHAADHGLGVVVRFPLAMGWLTPRAAALLPHDPERAAKMTPLLSLVDGDWQALYRLALHFVARLPEVSSVLVGTKNLDHLTQAIRALAEPIPPDWLRAAARGEAPKRR
ncbi:MAG: aldo/keto reductase [Thermaerobacter sp.]|nr:aldo/keto reductase [Thermaerobacter sp.]